MLEKDNKDHSIANAIVGGVCGVTLGWFYKQEASQAVLNRIKESELARNISADFYKSVQEHVTEFAIESLKAKTNELLSNKHTSDEKTSSKEANVNAGKNEKYESLVEENKRLDDMVRRLEGKIDELAKKEN